MKEKRNVGRPSYYTPELGAQLCEIYATHRGSIRKLCKENDLFPVESTFFLWLIKHAEFSENYALARKYKVAIYVDDIVSIADDSSNDKLINEDGEEVINPDAINRARLRIDARKWVACKEFPRVYGDKMQTETHTTVEMKNESGKKALDLLSKLEEK